jgi:hypothetical protein
MSTPCSLLEEKLADDKPVYLSTLVSQGQRQLDDPKFREVALFLLNEAAAGKPTASIASNLTAGVKSALYSKFPGLEIAEGTSYQGLVTNFSFKNCFEKTPYRDDRWD